MPDEKVFKVALSLTSGVGNVTTRHLISYCGSAEAVLKSTRGKLLKIPGIGPKTADAILNKESMAKAEQECSLAQNSGVQLLFYTESEYPKRLRTIADAPVLLYCKGNADLNAAKSVAVVGTRQATEYGKEITEGLIAELKRYPSVLVVSGLAYGIDITAHRAALKNGLPTVGVMASGMDIIYPALHKNTARQMLECGALLTEYSFATKPDAPHFPARNRIVAGLADILIVVEAARKGGALITAEIANGYNRDVMAVPGNIGQSHSEGCNYLVKDHKAHIYTGIDSLEALMNWQETSTAKKEPEWQEDPSLSEEEKQVITLLRHQKEMPIDQLSWQSQIALGKLASLLLNLELRGMVKALPGKRFTLTAA